MSTDTNTSYGGHNHQESKIEQTYEYSRTILINNYVKTLTPTVKGLLLEIFAEDMVNLSSEAYREIEKCTEEHLRMAIDMIPELLRQHRTIRDEKAYAKAARAFARPAAPFNWRLNSDEPEWYQRSDEEEDREEDIDEEWLKDPEAPPEVRAAGEIIDIVNKMHEDHFKFKHYMRRMIDPTMKATLEYYEENCYFDLSILSASGIREIKKNSIMWLEFLAEDLLSVITNGVEGKG